MARRQSSDPLERLDTPAWMTRALVAHLPALHGRDVIEPCAGANAIGRVLAEEARCSMWTFDIEPRNEKVVQADTMEPGFFSLMLPALRTAAIVTNTPFSLAAEYWRRTQSFAFVVLLVRITWLEATKDREDVRDPDALIILPRGRFTGPGAIDLETGRPYGSSDSATVCWAIWSADRTCLPVRPVIRVNRREKRELDAIAATPPLLDGVLA